MANRVMELILPSIATMATPKTTEIKRNYDRSGKLKKANFKLTSHLVMQKQQQKQQENPILFSIAAHLHAASREIIEPVARGNECCWSYTKSPILCNRPCLRTEIPDLHGCGSQCGSTFAHTSKNSKSSQPASH